MPPYTKSVPVIVQKQKDLIDAQKVALGIIRVYYGAQRLVPEYPAVAVEGGPKSRRIDTTRQYRLTLTTRVFIFHGRVDQTGEENTKQAEQLAEQVEDLLNSNLTMDGLVIHGMVTRIDPGVAVQNDVVIKSTRLIWEGISREGF